MDYAELAHSLSSRLGLRLPPIALAFVDQPPAGLSSPSPATSACALWRQAEERLFYAAAEDHFRCPLGAMVMGFALPDSALAQLQDEVKMMCGMAYVRDAEVPLVPKVGKRSAGIVYGPLRDFPLEPDVVLVWVTPQQAMVMGESCGAINWAMPPHGLLGRPGCASIPRALEGGQAELSLGCVGMRLNTGIDAELSLMVIPRPVIATLEAELDRICQVHHELEAHYRSRSANVLAL